MFLADDTIKEEHTGQKEKLIKRLKSKPKDFTFEEAETLLHKPHPRKELLMYQVKQLIEVLEQEGLL